MSKVMLETVQAMQSDMDAVHARSDRALEVIGDRHLVKREVGQMMKRSPSSERMLSVVRKTGTERIPVKRGMRRPGPEFAKGGMVASLTTVVLTGMRVLRPLNPLHTVAGYMFVGFTVWHMLQNEKRSGRG